MRPNPKWIYRTAIAAGCGLLTLSALFYIMLARELALEHAVAPGEDSLGVAALGMMYGLPILATAAGGLLSLLIGMSVMTFERFRTPE